jgi:broad specificity phosphatase PhoE
VSRHETDRLMEVLFVRHGEGEHQLDMPRSLDMLHPVLTGTGRAQVAALLDVVAVTDSDLLVVSPTPRTLETALILCGQASPARYVSRAVGPRIFPHKPGCVPLLCDRILDEQEVAGRYPGFEALLDERPPPAEEINTVSRERFESAAANLMRWCKGTGRPRLIVVSHDGSIHSYRELLGERNLTRDSFLGPAGVHRAEI